MGNKTLLITAVLPDKDNGRSFQFPKVFTIDLIIGCRFTWYREVRLEGTYIPRYFQGLVHIANLLRPGRDVKKVSSTDKGSKFDFE